MYSGKVIVDGPEEDERRRIVRLPVGHYRLTVAHRLDENEYSVGLFFEPVWDALQRSEIIVADEALKPPPVLSETCEIMSV